MEQYIYSRNNPVGFVDPRGSDVIPTRRRPTPVTSSEVPPLPKQETKAEDVIGDITKSFLKKEAQELISLCNSQRPDPDADLHVIQRVPKSPDLDTVLDMAKSGALSIAGPAGKGLLDWVGIMDYKPSVRKNGEQLMAEFLSSPAQGSSLRPYDPGKPIKVSVKPVFKGLEAPPLGVLDYFDLGKLRDAAHDIYGKKRDYTYGLKFRTRCCNLPFLNFEIDYVPRASRHYEYELTLDLVSVGRILEQALSSPEPFTDFSPDDLAGRP